MSPWRPRLSRRGREGRGAPLSAHRNADSFRWIFPCHWHNLRAEAGGTPAPLVPIRMPRSFPALARSPSSLAARERRSSRPLKGSSSRSRTSPRMRRMREDGARQDRIAYELSTPCRADLKGKKIMVIIGEEQSNGYISALQQNYGRHFQAINVRLRSLGLAHIHARGNPRADRAGGNRRVLQEQPGRRAVGGEAAGRELHPARPHLVAGKQESDHRRSTRST